MSLNKNKKKNSKLNFTHHQISRVLINLPCIVFTKGLSLSTNLSSMSGVMWNLVTHWSAYCSEQIFSAKSLIFVLSSLKLINCNHLPASLMQENVPKCQIKSHTNTKVDQNKLCSLPNQTVKSLHQFFQHITTKITQLHSITANLVLPADARRSKYCFSRIISVPSSSKISTFAADAAPPVAMTPVLTLSTRISLDLQILHLDLHLIHQNTLLKKSHIASNTYCKKILLNRTATKRLFDLG